MEPSANMAKYFRKKPILGTDYMFENFSPGWNFKLLNRHDEISSRMLSDSNVKTELQLYVKVNWAEISLRFEPTALKFSFHVNELKITM